jgi:cyanate permease
MVGVAVGPAAVGVIYEQSGGYTIPFVVLATASFLGLLVLQFGSRRQA